nr:endonuclease/exonuclease/phosphatase family protein [Lunatimonas salinarum]
MRAVVVLFFLMSLFLFFSVYISPEVLSYTGLLPLLIPVFMIFNLFLVVLFLFGKTRLILYPLIVLVIGWKFFPITFQWNQPSSPEGGLVLLSFNAMHFNQSWSTKSKEAISNSIEWARKYPADIKCFQEFHQDFSTPSRNALKLISNEGEYHYKYHPFGGNKKRSQGLAIFSKYPIVNDGTVFDNQTNNGTIFVDVKVAKDTIRVYNTHLESMNIPAQQLGELEGIKKNYRQTIRKLKNGIVMRARQIEMLMEHIAQSPYPVILAGDFNDVPYSYTYFTVRSTLQNAFEAAGRGFGFTYNKVLFFLRIDHIFTDKKFTIHQFKTHREVDYSDHYPISTKISWKPPI